jgi:hypothetical protein
MIGRGIPEDVPDRLLGYLANHQLSGAPPERVRDDP